MVTIIKAGIQHADLLCNLAKQTFIESHGHSAKEEDINSYIAEKYTLAILREELADVKNLYHIVYVSNKAAGFSKIILNTPCSPDSRDNTAKLERIYLLKEFYNLHLGQQLLNFNISLMHENKQSGVWLFVWKENERAVRFYKKNAFVIIGTYDFKISATHSNPNHQMMLAFQ